MLFIRLRGHFLHRARGVNNFPSLCEWSQFMKIGRVIGDTLDELPLIGPSISRARNYLRYRRIQDEPFRLKDVLGLVKTTVSRSAQTEMAVPVAKWLDHRWPRSRPLTFFPVKSDGPRLTIMTDSVGPSSLFGGVGTAIVLGTVLANRMNASLRLVTRTDPPQARAVREVLSANRLRLERPLEVVYSNVKGRPELPVSDEDYFLSTSWWSTASLLPSVRADRLLWLLQEDERMFYPFGDERLRCEQTLHDPAPLAIVNSRLLHEHLTSGAGEVPGLDSRSTWFEPAFPGAFPAEKKADSGCRRLFFYARPNHPRNLFSMGVAALAAAIGDGTFHPDEWEIHFVGQGIPVLELPRQVRPIVAQGLTWTEYQKLVRSMDAGFVLMDTPRPSYPPLDLAGSGAAVLTNLHGIKNDLSHYSRNILMAQPDQSSLRRGLARLAALGRDDAQRAANVQADGIKRDWPDTLSAAAEWVVERFAGGRACRERGVLRHVA